jgi:endonuclease G
MKVLMVLLTLFLATCTSVETPRATSAVGEKEVEIPTYDASEDIVRHLGYTASYNHTTLCPNWVAWELTAEEVAGTFEQGRQFGRDPDVAFPKASREDYSNSGWDKGHMAPHADMKWNRQAMTESDYFTNICPQNKEMNAGAWRKIEELTRRVAKRCGAVYVVCGPIFDSEEHRHIGPACVHVPDRFYKALAVNTTGEWQTVAFLVENNRQDGSPRSYAVTVDSVESVVGRDLFPSLPEVVEASYNWNDWK